MPRGKQSRGQCAFCGQELAKNGVARHLAACAQWKEAVAKSEEKKTKKETLYHLRVQATESSQFWLDLEMRGSATLGHLDDYLRAIWLECCGHLSQFSFGGWQGDEISMRRRISGILELGDVLTHIYDFGTSSETLIKAIGKREGHPVTTRPIVLLVRNVMPQYTCIECAKPASWLCFECLIEEDVWGTLCEKHKKTHPHGKDYGTVQIVNSPRLGMCGYSGPADPPY
jgi:hypothetical protein